MSKKDSTRNALLLLLGSIGAVSTASILIRFALNEASPLVISAYRMALAALIAAVLSLTNTAKEPFHPKLKDLAWMSLAGLFLALHFASWTTSLALVSVSSSVILVTTTPLWVALVSPIWLKEKISPAFYVGLALALDGSVLVGFSEACSFSAAGVACRAASLNSDTTVLSGLFLAVFGAWMAGGYLLIGRKLRGTIPVFPYTTFVYGISAVFLILALILRGEQMWGYSLKAYALFTAMAVIPQTLGHSVLNYSLEKLPASVVSLSLLGEPVGATVLAALFLNEKPSLIQIIGGCIILGGIVFAVWPRQVNAA